ncbi:Glycoside hydrolase [Populus alba x Populus x berolinensis]|nr:Glycoside hydrolase [Populus alba x Populus x berolinensis]
MALSKLPLYSVFFFLYISLSISSQALSSKIAVAQIKDQEDNEPFVGINIGEDVSNLMSATELVSFLQFQKVTHIKLYDADPDILKALAKTKIRVIISVPNNQLLAIGSSNTTAASWIGKNVVAYYPQTVITAIAVGDEVLTTVPSSAPLLMPAIESLYSALVAENLHNQIKISTPHSASIILDSFPPSQSFFNQSWISVIQPLLHFLSRTESPLMMNFYPYYVFMQNKGVVPLDNSLFKPLTPSKEMVDPNTLLHYTNVLDAMVDAAYFSMKNMNFTDVVVLVTESGWPSKGDSKEPYATIDNADTYNSNLIKHVLDRSGTPLHPEITSSVYLYELFNEDLRSPPVSEANWGLFYANSTPVYLLHVSGSGTFLANDTTNQTYCIVMDGVDSKTLQAALDWVCGPGRANCSEIQPGENCYQPNNVKNHASYAFDSYYQKEGRASGSCDFKGIAMTTTTDPSHGSCIFPGSLEDLTDTSGLDGDVDSSVGSVFMPLRHCKRKVRDPVDDHQEGGFRGVKSLNNVEVGGDGDSAKSGAFQGVKASNKGVTVLKDGGDGHSVRLGGFQGVKSSNKGVTVLKDESDGASVKLGAFQGARASNKGVAVLTEDTNSAAVLGSFKILSYNVWFREDLEMHRRMKALGELIQLHSPDVICLQEVIPDIYDIFQRSSWWKAYQCSVSSEIASSRGYFCMQLSKLPVKSFSAKPFMNSIMGRELCIAELEVPGKKSLVVATSHLESPCPAPPKWDQMFSKERVDQAKEAINLLKKNSNVIFCGDMNWDDKLDGQFPFPDGWVDAWVELKPGDNGWTYDTKSNQMLSGNRALQKRLDRFICSLCDFKISKIDMIGKDAIPGLSYMKEKKVRKEVKMLELPVLPSDHYGLLLTISGL